MKSCFALLFGVLLLVSLAFALTTVSKVTPDWTPEKGMTVTSERRPDGTISFTVTRYLDKAPEPGEGVDWTLERLAALEVRNQARLLATTNVAADTKKETATYEFILSPSCIVESNFSIAEFYAYKGVGEPGSKIYEVDLVACAPSAKPLHP